MPGKILPQSDGVTNITFPKLAHKMALDLESAIEETSIKKTFTEADPSILLAGKLHCMKTPSTTRMLACAFFFTVQSK